MIPQAHSGTLATVVDDDSGGLDAAQRLRRLRRRLEEQAVELAELERMEALKRAAYLETSRLLHFRAARHRQDAEAYAQRVVELRLVMERTRLVVAELEVAAG